MWAAVKCLSVAFSWGDFPGISTEVELFSGLLLYLISVHITRGRRSMMQQLSRQEETERETRMGGKAEKFNQYFCFYSKEYVYFSLFSSQSGLIQPLLVLYAALWEQHITAERDIETSHLHPLPSVSSSSSHHGNKSPRSDHNRGSRRKWTWGHVTKRLIDPPTLKRLQICSTSANSTSH